MTPEQTERAKVVAQVAVLFCEAGNIGWRGADRCEMAGRCQWCLERADAATPISENLTSEEQDA